MAVSEVTGVLEITPTDDSFFGDYTCEATNPRGRDSHTVTLIKVGKIFNAHISKVDYIYIYIQHV